MLSEVKVALRITASEYDGELVALIWAAVADLKIAGVTFDETDISFSTDDQGHIVDNSQLEAGDAKHRAIVTYCRVNFGSPADYDRLKAAYDEQKSQMQTATGYTDWLTDEEVDIGSVWR